jgi:hypothetical protein
MIVRSSTGEHSTAVVMGVIIVVFILVVTSSTVFSLGSQ